jgi:hypothetical protein
LCAECQVEQDEWKRVKRVSGEKPDVRSNPEHDENALRDDEPPTTHSADNRIGGTLPQVGGNVQMGTVKQS